MGWWGWDHMFRLPFARSSLQIQPRSSAKACVNISSLEMQGRTQHPTLSQPQDPPPPPSTL